jgi:hypothetical protein
MRALFLLFVLAASAAESRFEARPAGLLLTGDTGRADAAKDEVEAAGHARVVLPARSDKTLIRHGAGGLLTREPVVVTADRISVRAGILLRARGHVKAVVGDDRLEADELDVYLRIADGEARGRVLVNGEVPQRPRQRRLDQRRIFPPEIRK